MRPVSNPLKKTGGLVILKGNLAPDGCVLKVAGNERTSIAGPRASLIAKKTPCAP